jgi:phosphatidylserine decarboxylase
MPHEVGGWLPSNPAVLQRWIAQKVQSIKYKSTEDLSPAVAEFRKMVVNNPALYMLFSEMLVEVPAKYQSDPSHSSEIRDVDTLFVVLDEIIHQPPSWNPSAQFGVPMIAVLAWPMGTKAGFAAFLNENVNKQFKTILTLWAQFLLTPNSCSTLNSSENGWFSETALNSARMRDFEYNYVCDSTRPHWGFTSWDDFFTRKFRDGRRPVKYPHDDSIVVSAAEATPFAVQTNVKLHDSFWIKSQNYSLAHIMNNDTRAEKFVGGTVYQACLSPDSYHRWHAPVSGKIVSTAMVSGTYFSEPLFAGFSSDSSRPTPGAGAIEASQGYVSAVAARGIIFIQADNPDIALMCIIMIGMAEVSSIEITMPIGQSFKKGEQLGMFHYGGSSHCLIFGPWVNIAFNFPQDLPGPDNTIQGMVNSPLATATAAATK